MTDAAEPAALAAAVLRDAAGRELLVATDFDGTLSDLAPRPQDAILREDARRALQALAGRARVAVVSGRELSDLRARVAVAGVALGGEHGGDLLLPGGERRGVDLEVAERDALDVFARFADLLLAGTGGQVERKRYAVAAHTRGVADPSAQRRLEEALLGRAREVAGSHGLSALAGKRVVELRAAAASKALGLARLKTLLAPEAFVVALGDDATDEDLFREALRDGGVAIKVGEGETLAPHRLQGPDAVARFLASLVTGH